MERRGKKLQEAKMRSHGSQAVRLSLLVTALLVLGACAQQVGDIDRTQPDRVSKELFNGEWYVQHTVDEVPPSTEFTFPGVQSNYGERIVWEIQQDHLIARRAVEYLDGAQTGRGTSFNENEDGTIELSDEGANNILAAYRITSHFDIQRQYNSSTGEQSNVISENTSDRPWNERKWMRVDWSQNVATDWGFINDANGSHTSPVSYFVSETDTDNLDRPLITNEYIEIVGKWAVMPESIYYNSRYGNIPMCWLSWSADCYEQTIKVTTSFAKRTADREMYIPRVWSDKKDKKFQIFRTSRPSYDEEYGKTWPNQRFYANIFNIWDNENLPIAERQVRPIVYYLSANYPREDDAVMWATRKTANDWNQMFRNVAEDMGYPNAQEKDFFVVCENNPVKADDPEVCRTRVTYEKDVAGRFTKRTEDIRDITRNGYIAPGDIRFSMFVMHNTAITFGILGMGPWHADIETGEILSAKTNMYYATEERSIASMVDMIQLINGDLPLEDYVSGEYKRQRVEERRSPDVISTPQNLTAPRPMLMLDAIKDLRKEMISRKAPTGERLPDIDFNKVRENLQRRIQKQQEGGGVAVFEARRQKLLAEDKGQLVSLLRSEMEAETRNWPEEMKFDEERMMQTMPLVNTPRELIERDQARMRYMADNNILHKDAVFGLTALPMYASLAERFKGVDRSVLKDYVRNLAWYYTLAHEVGHNMGLQHSFGSSSDSLNFEKTYWLEKARLGFMPEYLVSEETRREVFDTNQELRGSQFASIMDYAAYDIVRDLKSTGEREGRSGLGKSDRAAIAYAYGDLLEVYDAGMVPSTVTWVDEADNSYTAQVRTDAIQFDPQIRAKANEFHYSYFPNFVFGEERVRVNLDPGNLKFDSLEVKPFDTNTWEVLVEGTEQQDGSVTVEVNQGRIDAITEVLYTAAAALTEGRRFVPASQIEADPNLIEVPFRTCQNSLDRRVEWCTSYDFGVDSWERIHNSIRYSEFSYYSRYFAREREPEYVPYYYSLQATMYEFDYILNQYKHWINRGLIENRPYHDSWFIESSGGYDGFLGALEVLEHWQEFMATPTMPEEGYRVRFRRKSDGVMEEVPSSERTYASQPIYEVARLYRDDRTLLTKGYVTYRTMDQYNDDDLDHADYIDLELGDARYSRAEYDPTLGYNFYYRPVRYGNWISKLIAVQLAADPYIDIVGTDTGADASYALNLATVFPGQVFETLSSYVFKDPRGYAIGIDYDDNMNPQVKTLPSGFDQLFGGALSGLVRYPAYIEPDESFTSRLYTMFYAGILFDLSSDNPYAEAMNVQLLGEDREIPDSLVEGQDYLIVPDIRTGQEFVVFRHNRQSCFFGCERLASPTWEMAEFILDAYDTYGYEEIRDTDYTSDDEELVEIQGDIEDKLTYFDRLRSMWWDMGFRYPTL